MCAVWRVRAVSKNRYLMTTKMTRMAIIYKDIEGELGGQLGDAIGGQGGEFAGEMVSPFFFLFHVAMVFVGLIAGLQNHSEDTIVQS